MKLLQKYHYMRFLLKANTRKKKEKGKKHWDDSEMVIKLKFERLFCKHNKGIKNTICRLRFVN